MSDEGIPLMTTMCTMDWVADQYTAVGKSV